MPKLTLSTRTASLAALAANFRAADKTTQREVKRLVVKHGRAHAEDVYDASPVDTSFMRDHIQLIFTDGGYAWIVGWDEAEFLAEGFAFYPVFVIFGTTIMPARDFFFPARDRRAKLFRADVSGSLKRSYARERRRGGGRRRAA